MNNIGPNNKPHGTLVNDFCEVDFILSSRANC